MKFKVLFLLLIVIITSSGCSSQVEFNGDRAYESLKTQVNFTQRYPEGKDAKACRDYLKAELEPNCHKYIEQDFTLRVNKKNLNLKNIIGIINPNADNFIIIGSHYDNRPYCDKDKDKKYKNTPCPGANDGASSTAVVLELAKVFKASKPKCGIVFVLFDGEDYGLDGEDMCLGSDYFASHLDVLGDIKPKINEGILLDMVGDANLNIYIEKISNYVNPNLVGNVWKAAKELDYEKYFIPKAKYSISDDHMPLIKKGIKCIDIIDFDYKYWHTHEDTPDKCSPKSLKIVGDVIIKYIYRDNEN